MIVPNFSHRPFCSDGIKAEQGMLGHASITLKLVNLKIVVYFRSRNLRAGSLVRAAHFEVTFSARDLRQFKRNHKDQNSTYP